MSSTTYNHRKGPTFAAAMKQSAEKRRCPNCERKSAIVRFTDDFGNGGWCRWPDCGYDYYRPFNDRLKDLMDERNWKMEMEVAMNDSGTWFTSHLLRLIAKADKVNRELIRLGFPDHVAAYDRWMAGVDEFTREDSENSQS